MAKANHMIEIPAPPGTVLYGMPTIFKTMRLKTAGPQGGPEGGTISGKQALFGLRLAGNPATVNVSIMMGLPGWSRIQMEATCFGFALNQAHVEGVLLDLEKALRAAYPSPPPGMPMPPPDDSGLPPRVV